jgi:hypothetical protein
MQDFAQPSVPVQPANQIVNQGFNATFRANGSGVPPLSYQWFFASNAIAGAVASVLTITNAQPGSEGAYFAVISDSSGAVTSRVATLTVILPVALDSKLGANIRIGADPFTMTNLHQAEMHVDRSPSDPDLLLAAYQDAFSSNDALGASYAISRDGGLTWASAFIPGVSKLSGGQLAFAADNVTSIDLDGNLFLITIGYSLSGGNLQKLVQFFSASFDGGKTFSAPLVVASSDTGTYPDKGWLTVNSVRNSRFAGRIAFTYTKAAMDNTRAETVLRYSDDKGKTWSAAKTIGPLRTIGSQTFFLPDGTLAVLYRRYLQGGYIPNSGAARMEIMTSEDAGQTFGTPILIQEFPSPYYSLYPDIWDAPHFPSACSDRQAGVIYVAYQAFGASSRRSILFTKSIDKGRTWSAPVPVNDTPDNLEVFNPAVAVSPDGQHVIVEFYDKRNQTATSAGNNADLYLAESFDGGDSWEPNIRLSDFSSDLRRAAKKNNEGAGVFLGDYQAITPSLNFDTPAVATWIDTRAGNNDPYSVRIWRTKGTTFDTWRKLRFSTNDLGDANISGEKADPDHDGICNLSEYVFGLEPNRADASPLQLAVNTDGVESMVMISYEHLDVLGEIIISWEHSSDLLEWTSILPTQEVIEQGRDSSMKRVKSSFSVSEQKGFFRLRFRITKP